ncbi:hypothetical protein SNE40_016140 [Patella caerulea]|uniref:SprT-like domain-containing protein n=1 Tax=Patella caerulea TaxID=87958 RepID=A0AAN8JDJ5_PATCE
MAEKTLTPCPASDVNDMFRKMGEKLGWFQHKDIDSAIKTLSQKKKSTKSRLKLKCKDDKENTPLSVKNSLKGNTSEQRKSKTKLSKSPLHENQRILPQNPVKSEISPRKNQVCTGTDLKEEIRQEKLIRNTSVISPYPDGEVYSILEDVGMPLVESTRIHSRQSIDGLRLSIDQETGEDDSYEDLKIRNKKSEQKRISELYITAVESQNDYYTVSEMATQTPGSSDSSDNKANNSQSSEGSFYEVKDMAIQTDSPDCRNISKSFDNSFVNSADVSSHSSNGGIEENMTETNHGDDCFIKETIVENDESKNRETNKLTFSPYFNKKKTSQQTMTELPKNSIESLHTPQINSLKSKLFKNKITKASFSDSDEDFSTPRPFPSGTKKKHKLYTPSDHRLSPQNMNFSAKKDKKKALAKMKAMLSSDSEDEIENKTTKSTPSKYYTPRSTAVANYSDQSDDTLPDLNLDRYKVTVAEPTTSWRNSAPILSSDEDDLEKFLESVKKPVKPKKSPVSKESLKDFIVDDDISISSGSDDDEIFYISTQSPRNKGCTLVSPVSRSVKSAIVDINTPLSQRVKHTSSLSRPPPITPVSAGTDVFKTPHRPTITDRSVVKTLSEKKSSVKSTSESNSKPYSFIRSLSTDIPDHKRHPDSIRFTKQFKKTYEELTAILYKIYNETVFDLKLPEDLSIIWNKRLLRTAGYCAYKRVNGQHVSRIELSTKVCDTPERVRDTLIHELCHAAVWMLNKQTDGHGPYWKYWARKANVSHPYLPIISRCHDYSITTKYTYVCTQCGYQIGRHSKSLDTNRKLCGYCHGTFQLADTPGSKKGTPRTPNRFALFVKENYGSAKKGNTDFKHKDIMQLLSQQFAEKTKLDST